MEGMSVTLSAAYPWEGHTMLCDPLKSKQGPPYCVKRCQHLGQFEKCVRGNSGHVKNQTAHVIQTSSLYLSPICTQQPLPCSPQQCLSEAHPCGASGEPGLEGSQVQV